MQNPLISIIVPVFNSADTISECLTSLCEQTYKNIEIIVVYLKSNDDTLAKIQQFSDKRIKIIEQIEKNGAGGARNIGLDNVSGQWVGFAEADDFVDADFYEKLISSAMKENSEIVQAQTNVNNRVFEQNYPCGTFLTIFDKYSLIKNGASFDKIFSINLIRKNNLRFEEYVRFEDNPFIFKAFFFANKITVVDDTYYHYRPNNQAWTDEYKEILRKSVIPITTEIMNFIKSQNLSSRETKLVKQKIIVSYAGEYLADKIIYPELLRLMNYPLFLRIMHWRKQLKLFKRKYFHSKKRGKK